eukprot:8927463-Alexandrium_andersonii.AAC.1
MGCSTKYINAGKVEAGAWLEGCEQSFGGRYAHPASRAAVEVFWAARPHTAEAAPAAGWAVGREDRRCRLQPPERLLVQGRHLAPAGRPRRHHRRRWGWRGCGHAH